MKKAKDNTISIQQIVKDFTVQESAQKIFDEINKSTETDIKNQLFDDLVFYGRAITKTTADGKVERVHPLADIDTTP